MLQLSYEKIIAESVLTLVRTTSEPFCIIFLESKFEFIGRGLHSLLSDLLLYVLGIFYSFQIFIVLY